MFDVDRGSSSSVEEISRAQCKDFGGRGILDSLSYTFRMDGF